MLALTRGTLALIAVRVVDALGPIQARSAGAVINVDLTHGACEAWKRHRGDICQRLTHLPLLKQWVESLSQHMPRGHQGKAWRSQALEVYP